MKPRCGFQWTWGEHIYKLDPEPTGLLGNYLPSKALKWREHHLRYYILYIKNWDGVTLLRHWPLSIFDGRKQQVVNNGERKVKGEGVRSRAGQVHEAPKNCTFEKIFVLRDMPVRHDPPFDSLELSISCNEIKMRDHWGVILSYNLSTSLPIRHVNSLLFLPFEEKSQKVLKMSSAQRGLGFACCLKALKHQLKASLWRRAQCLKAALTPWPKYNWWCHVLLWAIAKAICFNACNCTRAYSITCS